MRFSILDYKTCIQEGDNLLEKGEHIKAAEAYRKAIDILDMSIKLNPRDLLARGIKFRLLDLLDSNKSLSNLIIPSLILQKIAYLKKINPKAEGILKSCIYCSSSLKKKKTKLCPKCGKDLRSDEAIIWNEFKHDVYKNILNFEYLAKFFDQDLGNSEKKLIYEKKFENLHPDFVFPNIHQELLIIAIIGILQLTKVIQRIWQPDLLTIYSIRQIFNTLYQRENLMGKKLNLPWGLLKIEETNFTEEFEEEAIESRRDLIISYKDASPVFDYETYFFIPSSDLDYSQLNVDRPEINTIGYTKTIENKISAFATKLKDGAYIYKIYLLESKTIELFKR
ncbi:MAG: hypothetical protein ACFE8E_14680 [Candidatus Hodarchaeota archaeon]